MGLVIRAGWVADDGVGVGLGLGSTGTGAPIAAVLVARIPAHASVIANATGTSARRRMDRGVLMPKAPVTAG